MLLLLLRCPKVLKKCNTDNSLGPHPLGTKSLSPIMRPGKVEWLVLLDLQWRKDELLSLDLKEQREIRSHRVNSKDVLSITNASRGHCPPHCHIYLSLNKMEKYSSAVWWKNYGPGSKQMHKPSWEIKHIVDKILSFINQFENYFVFG